ncbi:hypothetical protein [Actinomadura coerulea]
MAAPHPTGGQAQYIDSVGHVNGGEGAIGELLADGSFGELLAWLVANLGR